jgi:diaminohydroxyphosphoribosylaminopyrimidine deaminase / 5-amino-6-(5-phosphoribosylamino)uracil reductase
VNGEAIFSAWNAILAARGHDWASIAALETTVSGTPVTIHAGGAWQARRALQTDVSELLDCLLPLAAHVGPMVIAQLGQSLDGRIATESGASHYINGEAALAHLHRLRALVDVVVVGAGTAAADRPQLTVRRVQGRSPARAVLDPRGRVPLEGPLFASTGDHGTPPTLHLVGPGVASRPPTNGSRQVVIAEHDGEFEPSRVVAALAGEGYRRVLVEGGGVTVSRFLAAGALDRLHVLVAPLILGSGRPAFTLTPVVSPEHGIRAPIRRFSCGEDTLFDVMLQAGQSAAGEGRANRST